MTLGFQKGLIDMTTIYLHKQSDGMYWAQSHEDSLLLGFIANNSVAINEQGLTEAQIIAKALGWKIIII